TSCSLTTPVAASGGTCTISLIFTPSATAAGNRTGTLTLVDNGPNTSQSVSLVGHAATILAFSSQAVGTMSEAYQVGFANSSSTQLAITGIAITGANSGDFTQTNNC